MPKETDTERFERISKEIDERKRREFHAAQAARRESEKGLIIEEIMAKRRLEQPERAERESRAMRRELIRHPGKLIKRTGLAHVATPRGRREREEAEAQRAPGASMRQAVERDWDIAYRGLVSQRAPASTLREYREQFEDIRAQLGPAADFMQGRIEEDFVAGMPPAVAREYAFERQAEEAEKEAERAAAAVRIRTTAEAALTGARRTAAMTAEERFLQKYGGARTQRAAQRAAAVTKATGEAREELERRFAESKRKRAEADALAAEATRLKARKQFDAANSALDRAEQLRKAATQEEIDAKYEKGRLDREARRQRRALETAEEFAAEAEPARRERGIARERATLELREKIAKRYAPARLQRQLAATAALKKQGREIERELGPRQAEQVAGMRTAWNSATKVFWDAEKKYQDAVRERYYTTGERKVTMRRTVAQLQAKRDKAHQMMKYWENQYSAGLGLPEPPTPEVGVPLTMWEPKTRKEKAAYERYTSELGDARVGGLDEKESKRLDKLWRKTGAPEELSEHAGVDYKEPPPYTPPREAREGRVPVPVRELSLDEYDRRYGETLTPRSALDHLKRGIISAETFQQVFNQRQWRPSR
jgi:hypothetical protein